MEDLGEKMGEDVSVALNCCTIFKNYFCHPPLLYSIVYVVPRIEVTIKDHFVLISEATKMFGRSGTRLCTVRCDRIGRGDSSEVL